MEQRYEQITLLAYLHKSFSKYEYTLSYYFFTPPVDCPVLSLVNLSIILN